jgi:hypothetical protein
LESVFTKGSANILPFLVSDNLDSVDLLSMTGRVQAYDLGESFAERYGFNLMNNSHVYEIEYGG